MPGNVSAERLTWTEYKTLKQYPSMGAMLDEFRVYGFRAAVEKMFDQNRLFSEENAHNWLEAEPQGEP